MRFIERKVHSCGIAIFFAFGHTAGAQMTTAQYDNARTGAYLNEKTLTPQNVNQRQFGKLFTLKVDGDIYAPAPLPRERSDSWKRPA